MNLCNIVFNASRFIGRNLTTQRSRTIPSTPLSSFEKNELTSIEVEFKDETKVHTLDGNFSMVFRKMKDNAESHIGGNVD